MAPLGHNVAPPLREREREREKERERERERELKYLDVA